MKKGMIICMLAVVLVFCGFSLGFLLGRQGGGVSLQYSPAPTTAVTEPLTEPPPAPFPIDLNTATAAELTALPGIGPVLAERIVTHREETGFFLSVEELTDIYGIDVKKLEAIRNLITVGG